MITVPGQAEADHFGNNMRTTFFGMLYLVVRDNPYLSGLQVVGLLILGIPFILYLDVKHIFPASQKYSTRKNPEMMEIKKIVKRIDEKMDGKS